MYGGLFLPSTCQDINRSCQHYQKSKGNMLVCWNLFTLYRHNMGTLPQHDNMLWYNNDNIMTCRHVVIMYYYGILGNVDIL